MDIKDTLIGLSEYYNKTRQYGHTTLLIEGTKNIKDHLVLTDYEETAHSFRKNLKINAASINSASSLMSRRCPIVLDNSAVESLLKKSIERIEMLECIVNLIKPKEMEYGLFFKKLRNGDFNLNYSKEKETNNV